MAKAKSSFVCAACGCESPRWMGRCPECGAWNTMEEAVPAVETAAKPLKQRGGRGTEAVRIGEIEAGSQTYQPTGIGELDRVLGGGVVEGALILVGGEPGVGKSTLLLQVCAELSRTGKRILYISGEESARQIKLRAQRLGADKTDMLVLTENAMDAIEKKLNEIRPDYCVVDSIQTVYRPEMASAPGSVSQVRESASLLMRYAKENGCGVFLVGHVTKEGAIAGPRVLEHMVDVVLYFEGDRQHEYRLLRAVKNRFGSVNELGVFEMTGDGMRPVENASETLLSQRAKGASGSCVLCGMEGTRPVLVDIQALVAQSFYAVPRRTVNGMDNARIMLLLAVMEKRGGLKLFNKDVYINVAGGMSLSEPAADLAVCAAVASSFRDTPLPPDLAVMGEVGLAGEVRSIARLDRRIAECHRLGFNRIVCPKDSLRRISLPEGVTAHGVDTVAQAFAVMDLLPGRDGAK
ncbi:MAG: DNA repair protein RadA [Clostridiales bacterium]|nr:DNA repair protein RadA [Clostridiales bacterium]